MTFVFVHAMAFFIGLHEIRVSFVNPFGFQSLSLTYIQKMSAMHLYVPARSLR
jgi:hypothetical protein